MKQRTTEIFIETREKIVFRQNSAREIETVCARCGGETVFIEPERAAFLFGLSMREIFRRVESGAVHFIEDQNGLTRICPASLETIKRSRIELIDGEIF